MRYEKIISHDFSHKTISQTKKATNCLLSGESMNKYHVHEVVMENVYVFHTMRISG